MEEKRKKTFCLHIKVLSISFSLPLVLSPSYLDLIGSVRINDDKGYVGL